MFDRNIKLFSVVLLTLSVTACGGSGSGSPPVATPPVEKPGISLTAPAIREDGTALSLSAIAGYRVYFGTVSGDYQSRMDLDPVTQSFDFGGLATRVYAVVTTVDVDGRESLYSDEVIAEN